jgi:hypothetical protein
MISVPRENFSCALSLSSPPGQLYTSVLACQRQTSQHLATSPFYGVASRPFGTIHCRMKSGDISRNQLIQYYYLQYLKFKIEFSSTLKILRYSPSELAARTFIHLELRRACFIVVAARTAAREWGDEPSSAVLERGVQQERCRRRGHPVWGRLLQNHRANVPCPHCLHARCVRRAQREALDAIMKFSATISSTGDRTQTVIAGSGTGVQCITFQKVSREGSPVNSASVEA